MVSTVKTPRLTNYLISLLKVKQLCYLHNHHLASFLLQSTNDLAFYQSILRVGVDQVNYRVDFGGPIPARYKALASQVNRIHKSWNFAKIGNNKSLS